MKLLRQRWKQESLSEREPRFSTYQPQGKRKGKNQRPMFTEQQQEVDTSYQLHSIHVNPNLSTFYSDRRPTDPITSQAISKAEQFLEINFKPEMDGYLINKFRKFVKTRNSARTRMKSIPHSQTSQFGHTLHSQLWEKQSHLTCTSCQKQVKKVAGNEGIFIQQAKQKVLRLMELRREKEQELSGVAENIKFRSVRTEKRKKSRNLDVEMPELQKEEWDREWQSEHSLSIKRYRTRIMQKSKERNRPKMKKAPSYL